MKQLFTGGIVLLLYTISFSQNIGIGTTAPGFPLNFSNALGDKISLHGNSGAHYGFGVQGGLLQIHSDAAGSNIAFGHGSSASFTERMRIFNSGETGLQLNGRLVLRNGTTDPNSSPGMWLTKADNSELLGFIGVQSGQNFGFYGAVGGWGLVYDATNNRVGIGTTTPNAPLSFPATLGRKVTLFPGGAGNVGLGVHANELRIHTDHQPADITMGFENLQGNFTERFRFKGNGALLVGGQAGSAGQFLRSNGASSAPSWATPAKETVSFFNQTSNTNFGGSGLEVEVSGLNGTFFVSVPSTVIFGANMNILSANLVATSYGYAEVRIIEGISNQVASARSTGSMDPFRKTSLHPTGAAVLNPGTYTIKGFIGRLNVADLPASSVAEAPSQIWVKVVPN